MNEYRERFNELKGVKQRIVQESANLQRKIKQQRKDLKHHESAKEIIRLVGIDTQNQLKFHLEDITSLAMESIFDNPYNLVLDFIQRRDKTECDLFFERNGKKMNPIDASGGGAVNIASFALRIASWSMTTPKLNNTILLDEPFSNVSEDLKEKASRLLKEVSEKLGIQFIIITHDETLTAMADKIFKVIKSKKVSKIKVNE